MKIELNCINCNKNFEAEFKRRDKKFCNRKCYFEYANKNSTIGRKKDETIREIRLCVMCNNTFEAKKKQNIKLCSNECRKKWNAIPFNKANRIDASKKKLLENYGVDSVFKRDDFRVKATKTLINKYGVNNPMKSPVIIKKLQNVLKQNQLDRLLPKLKINNLELLDDYTVNKNKSTSLSYNFKCLKCSNIFTSTLLGSGKIPICRKCFPLLKNSKLEEFFKEFLNNNKIKHLDNNRKILEGQEIDILINNTLGIEVNGNYFHSEMAGEKDKYYHINKSNLAYNKGIKLIHIFEDEFLYKKDIVISRLSNLLKLNTNKIYARKCTIREILKNESNDFLEKNHLQGSSIDSIRLGLYYNNNLVSVITFGSLRKSMGSISKSNHFELLRFSNLLNTNVIGSFSKLLNYFIKTYNPDKIITYADIRWSGLDTINNVYVKNGFTYIKNTPPNYWYLKFNEYNNRYHRFNFRKDILIKEGFDQKLTEFEIMRLKGYDKIWDCGNMKFEYSK